MTGDVVRRRRGWRRCRARGRTRARRRVDAPISLTAGFELFSALAFSVTGGRTARQPAQWRRFTGEGEGARLPTCTTVSTARARGASEAKRRSIAASGKVRLVHGLMTHGVDPLSDIYLFAVLIVLFE
uniref:Uncharacterized protein n=1 Tax=Oryza nivara TaxID=4536 RepID=A0A0E0I1N2_ORYNI